jgi:translation initiation factor 1
VTRLFAGTAFDQPPTCDRCGKLQQDCQCPPPPPPPPTRIPPEKQTARIATEKRKKGKMVTVIRGLSAEGNDLPELLTQLKNSCGAGGTVREDELEVQGSHVERVREVLVKRGYRVR